MTPGRFARAAVIGVVLVVAAGWFFGPEFAVGLLVGALGATYVCKVRQAAREASRVSVRLLAEQVVAAVRRSRAAASPPPPPQADAPYPPPLPPSFGPLPEREW